MTPPPPAKKKLSLSAALKEFCRDPLLDSNPAIVMHGCLKIKSGYHHNGIMAARELGHTMYGYTL